jgi:murein L,D-transpeptidase YcbB/YkuD
MTYTIDMARLGYKQSAREKETKKTPGKPSLDRVIAALHYDYAQLLKSPPTKQEARFLSKDMETLLHDLEYADKGMQAIPGIEKRIDQIEARMYQAMADKNPDRYNELDLSLKNEQKILNEIQAKVKDSIRAAEAYHQNNTEDIWKSTDTIKTLRTELSAPYRYSDAKDGMPVHSKPVLNWLDDLKNKPSPDDRVLASKVLEQGGIDAKGILTEADRRDLSSVDKAVAEMREKGEAKLP